MSWQKTWYPCKHFFAVSKKYPAWNWESVSPLYSSSPYINLDNEIIPIYESEETEKAPDEDNSLIDRTEDPVVHNDPSNLNLNAEIPRPKRWNTNTSTYLRELLKEIQDSSYLVLDQQIVEECCFKLKEIRNRLNESTPREDNLPLEPSQQATTRKKRHKNPRFRPYALRVEKKKNRFTKRHGEFAAKMKMASEIKVEAAPRKEKKVKEEAIEVDVVDLNEPLYFNGVPGNEVQIIDVNNDNEEDEEDVNVDEWHGWEPEILTEREILIIKGNDMLTDVSMNCAQEILKKQFPCPGLQSTYLGQALRFKEEEEKFCQILHNGSLHWIAISNLNCQDGSSIEYFDSLFHGRVKDHIKLQICNLFKCKSKSLVIHVRFQN